MNAMQIVRAIEAGELSKETAWRLYPEKRDEVIEMLRARIGHRQRLRQGQALKFSVDRIECSIGQKRFTIAGTIPNRERIVINLFEDDSEKGTKYEIPLIEDGEKRSFDSLWDSIAKVAVEIVSDSELFGSDIYVYRVVLESHIYELVLAFCKD